MDLSEKLQEEERLKSWDFIVRCDGKPKIYVKKDINAMDYYKKNECYEDIKQLFYPNQDNQEPINYHTIAPIKVYYKIQPEIILQEQIIIAGWDNKDCVDLALNDISRGVSSFHIKSSKWNKQIGVNQLVVQVRENPEYDENFIENTAKDWKIVSWYSNMCGFYNFNESDKNIKLEIVKNTEFHSNFYAACKDQKNINLNQMEDLELIEFWESIKDFCQQTQLFSFTE
ncbi:hypothetical protein IMG5_005470 [Ichthyophthirius multifiliis]|uniref:Uncharacterized protein n=1 Tax=Ichthyophthirius multifiliis TaxID=5932 RepID=G0QJH4_ICHMU|nr:hypothetical protein IMG5_005470 [Ichthyophthirius multifiliis]EGR34625.1 hypothetical protein IMG5_005470 [Ichthyophthirius multifiliis]|eukprot:XP_004039929.1 hypothetical protein IMG5_005470 [Ichthyophthirius multifiliis]